VPFSRRIKRLCTRYKGSWFSLQAEAFQPQQREPVVPTCFGFFVILRTFGRERFKELHRVIVIAYRDSRCGKRACAVHGARVCLQGRSSNGLVCRRSDRSKLFDRKTRVTSLMLSDRIETDLICGTYRGCWHRPVFLKLFHSVAPISPSTRRFRLPRSTGAPPKKILKYLVILCFEWRYPKENTIASLKSKIVFWLRCWE